MTHLISILNLRIQAAVGKYLSYEDNGNNSTILSCSLGSRRVSLVFHITYLSYLNSKQENTVFVFKKVINIGLAADNHLYMVVYVKDPIIISKGVLKYCHYTEI